MIEKVHQGIGKADYIYVKVPRDGAESSQATGGSPLPLEPPVPVTDDRRQRYPITADDGNALPATAVTDDRRQRYSITGDGGNPLPGSKNYREKDIEQKQQSKSIRGYGQFENVFLSDEEFARLCRVYPQIQPLLDDMSCYLASTGKTYQNYEAALQSWARRSKDSYAAISYEYKEGESL